MENVSVERGPPLASSPCNRNYQVRTTRGRAGELGDGPEVSLLARPQQSIPVSDGSPLPTYALDSDQVTADADEGDAGHATAAYIHACRVRAMYVSGLTQEVVHQTLGL
jgi:hypothetical protein